MSADGGEAVAIVHPLIRLQRRKYAEPGLWRVHHGDGDGAVEGHDRAWRHRLKEVIQRQDLGPVRLTGGTGLGVDGGDRGLELVRTERRPGQRAGDEREAPGDLTVVGPQPVDRTGEPDRLRG